MYRDFAKRKARALNIKGCVENRDDGAVHIVAQGSKEDLERFVEYLHKGPFGSRVADVSISWREPIQNYERFTINY